MNKAAFYSKPIKTIILNDFRRFWVLSLAEFLALFLATTSVVIIHYSDLASVSSYIQSIMDMSNVFITALVCIFAILSSVVVFRYMHLVNAVTASHSLPVTRGMLYTGHFISGYLIASVPVALNGIILMIISKPVYYDEIPYLSIATEALNGRNIFTAKSVLVTMLLLLLIMLFVYAVSVFAGMLCGTSVMHIIGAFGLNLLIPALLAFVCEYAQLFLYGFSTSSSMLHTIKLSSPVLSIPSMRHAGFHESDSISVLPLIIYILIAAAVILAGYLLYRHRKLENATEPLVFKVMIPVVCGLITFFASTILGLFAEGNRFFIWFAAGTIVFYILSRMLSLKTTRVFNKKTFKSLGIYTLIVAVFVGIFVFDATGYENRIPAEESVSSVSTDLFVNGGYQFTQNRYNSKTVSFTSKENIESIRKLHEEMLAQKPSSIISGSWESILEDSTLSCSYTLKNGHVVSRSYDVPQKFTAKSKALKAIYESDEYKEIFSLYNTELFSNPKASFSLVSYISVDVYSSAIKDSELSELMAVMEKDFRARTFEEELDADNALGAISISNVSDNATTTEIPVLKSDANTINWLKKHGYYAQIDPANYIIETASLYSNTSDCYFDITSYLKGRSLEEIIKRYPDEVIQSDSYYELSLDMKRADSSNTYYYSILFSEESFPADLKRVIFQ